MSLDLDPTEQQLAAALDRLAAAYVPDAGDPPVPLPVRRHDHRRWLALAVAASLIALVAGIWAVADRGTDPAPVTVPPTPAPPPTATATPAPRPLPESVGVLSPDATVQLGLGPTAWLQREPDSFIIDTGPLAWAIRRDAVAGVATWQVVPPYEWQSGQLGVTEVSLDDGRTALRLADDVQVTLSIQIDAGVLTTTIGVDDEAALRAWLSDVDPMVDAAGLEPPEGYELVGFAVAKALVVHTGSAGTAASDPSALNGVFVITTDLDRDATLADMLSVKYGSSAFAPLADDPSLVFDPGLRVLAWQAGPRTLVEVPGTASDTVAAIAAGLTLVPSDSPDLVAGARDFTAPVQIPASSLTRTVLGATPFGRFAYSELDDGSQTCWRIVTILGGTSDCDGSRSQRPICIASRASGGPWTALVIVVDADTEPAIVLDDTTGTTTEIATGVTDDGSRWAVGRITGIPDVGGTPSATITVDGTPCPI